MTTDTPTRRTWEYQWTPYLDKDHDLNTLGAVGWRLREVSIPRMLWERETTPAGPQPPAAPREVRPNYSASPLDGELRVEVELVRAEDDTFVGVLFQGREIGRLHAIGFESPSRLPGTVLREVRVGAPVRYLIRRVEWNPPLGFFAGGEGDWFVLDLPDSAGLVARGNPAGVGGIPVAGDERLAVVLANVPDDVRWIRIHAFVRATKVG